MSTLPNTPLEQTPGTALAGHSSTAKPLGPHVESELAGETRKIYDRIARTYAIRWAEIPDGLLPFMELLVRHSEQDGLVLDVGCGHGRDLAWFERHGTRVL
ncbi:MAG: class I SAM-dependent methyltransferase, partial [Actinomycetota bacterium]